MIHLLGDMHVPLRDITYLEPDGFHVAIGRGREIGAALAYLAARPECTGLAVVGAPTALPDLSALAGRRVFVTDGEGGRLRDFTAAALATGAEVEWAAGRTLPLERLASWALPVAGLVLAAGSSRRMGTQKLLLDLAGQPLVSHAVEAASEGGCHAVWVVHAAPEVAAAVAGRATIVFNPDAESGMASSLREGLRALPDHIAGALVLLGDQPMVGARTVRMLLKAWRAEGARPAVAAAYRGAWRPPVLLARELWPEMEALDGDAGARQVLDRRPELLDTVPAQGREDDIDTPEDYARILRLPRRDPR